jgi:murein DD-endopeptidase MepM/ murein hydrolase activator NlpD
MFDSEIANNISQTQSLGIGDLLYRQLVQLETGRHQETPFPTGEGSVSGTTSVPLANMASNATSAAPITSEFGIRKDPLDGALRFHNGIDMAAPAGTPFRTVDGGTVAFAGMMGTYGNTVVVDHPNGDRTLYAHASSVLVQAGQQVAPDEVIGTVGSTGRATGPHLHFELRRNGENINPNEILELRSPLAKNKS